MSGNAFAPPGIGFGVAVIKKEGAAVRMDPASTGDDRKAVESDWMELRIPRKASRKAVHAMVDRWLDAGRGRKGD